MNIKKYVLTAAAFLCALGAFAQWKYPLYLDGGEPAKKRAEIAITNNTDKPLDERVLFIKASEIGLAGERAASVRVVEENGNELLFAIAPYAPVVSEDAVITIPFKCPAGGKTSVYVYYGNGRASDVPDFYLYGAVTENFGQPAGETLRRWHATPMSEEHTYDISLSKDGAHSFGQCARINSMNKNRSWYALRRVMQVNEGAEYLFEGWIRVADIAKKKGDNIGIHLSLTNESENRFLILNAPRADALKDIHSDANIKPEKCGWTKVSKKIKVPEGYKRLVVKTKTFCNADVYFDDFSVREIAPSADFSYEIKPVETLEIAREKAVKKWEVSKSIYDTRITATFFNLTEEPCENMLGIVPIKRAAQGNFPTSDYKVLRNGKPVPFGVLGESLIFCIKNMKPMSEAKFNIYLRADRKNQNVKTTGARQASYIPSDQVAEVRNKLSPEDFEAVIAGCKNLLANPGFEAGAEGWTYRRGEESKKFITFADEGAFGKKSMRLKIEKEEANFPGIEQRMPAKRGATYTAILWGKNLGGANMLRAPEFHIEQIGGKGVSRERPFLVSGGEWELQSATLKNDYEKANIAFKIISKNPIDFLFDGAVVCESKMATRFDYATPDDSAKREKTAMWQVNSIVKIFPFFPMPANPAPAKISLAKNEAESLQIAARSNRNLGEMKISAPAPKLEGDESVSLGAPEVGTVGMVAVDNVSAYNMFNHFKFYERCIPPVTMLEYYPDPILPAETLTLKKNRTETIFLSFSAGADAKAGTYKGAVELIGKDGKAAASLPYTVVVRNFALPKGSSLGAMFSYADRGYFGKWRQFSLEPGMMRRAYDRFKVQEFVGKKRITIDTPPAPFKPVKGGDVAPDFAEFDKFCDLAFNKQNVPLLYIPLPIQKLNWARPLKPMYLNGKIIPAIEGEWPYKGKDLTKISPEFVAETQRRVKMIYDHVREKNWQDKFVFFVSDEPYYWRAPIAGMLNRYCDIIREAAPELKIYSSTWAYTDTLKNAVDAWGLNISAANTPKEIDSLNAQKNKLKIFTTDGNYCIDTPYNAQERIMSIYCYAGGFAAYEYWGVLWNTQNPFKWAVHKDRISDSDPTNVRRNRYPNGDGYFIYYGGFIGKPDELYSSIRLEAIRDGQEDFEYYKLLEKLAEKTGDAEAKKLLDDVKSIAVYPNAGGRKSAEFLPNPNVITILRDKVAENIERLLGK